MTGKMTILARNKLESLNILLQQYTFYSRRPKALEDDRRIVPLMNVKFMSRFHRAGDCVTPIFIPANHHCFAGSSFVVFHGWVHALEGFLEQKLFSVTFLVATRSNLFYRYFYFFRARKSS